MSKVATVALMLGLLSAPALAGAREDGKVIMPDDAAARAFMEKFGFAEAVVTPDGTIYTSAVVADLADDNDFDAAYERAFAEMGSILTRAGAGWDDVVEMTSFHTDLTSQIEPFRSVKSRYLKPPFPAWTAVEISRLFTNRGITEIKLVAKLPKTR